MTASKKMKIIMSESERQVIKKFISEIQDTFGIYTEEYPEVVIDLIDGIYCGSDRINTNIGKIEIEYKDT